MRNSESAHLFTYNYFWQLVSIKHTTQQLSFNNIDADIVIEKS